MVKENEKAAPELPGPERSEDTQPPGGDQPPGLLDLNSPALTLLSRHMAPCSEAKDEGKKI